MMKTYGTLTKMSRDELIEHYDESVRTDTAMARFYLAELRHRDVLMFLQSISNEMMNHNKRIEAVENVLTLRRMD